MKYIMIGIINKWEGKLRIDNQTNLRDIFNVKQYQHSNKTYTLRCKLVITMKSRNDSIEETITETTMRIVAILQKAKMERTYLRTSN